MARRPLFKAAVPLAAILILAAGCGDHSPTAVSLESSSIAEARSGAKANVVSHQHESGTYWANIGKHGGTLDFGIGTISFPAGALEKTTKITAVTDGETMSVTFGPHGTQFPVSAQPTITFQVGDSGVPAGAHIAYVNGDDEIIELVVTEWNSSGTAVSGKLPHFSKLVLAAT